MITVTLQPGEARIWSLSTAKDTKAPQLTLAKATADNTIELTFDERVTGTPAATVSGANVTKAEVSANQRKVTLTTSTLSAGSKVTVSVSGLKDLTGNAAAVNTEVVYQENQVVAKASAKTDLKNANDVTETTDEALAGKTILGLAKAYELNGTAVTGTADFAVSSYVKTTGNNMNILKQEGAYSLSIDKDGKAVFTVGDVSVTSKEAVNDGTWKHIAGIREKNGSLKVYVNGTLDASRYEKNIKDLKDGTLTVGGGTDLQVSQAEVKDATLKLTALEKAGSAVGGDSSGDSGIVPDGNGKIPLQASNITVKRADNDQDVSNKKSSPEKMIDGDKGSNSFTCTLDGIESDVLAGTSVYFQIDLGDVFKLDQVKMWRYFADGRTYQDTIVVASEDAAFDANDTVLYSSVSDSKYAYGLLSNEKLANPDAKYAETSEGKTFEAKEQKARYIRIYTRGSILTSGTAHGGNHICEVEVYGKAIKNTTTQKKITVAFDTKGGNSIESLKVAAGESWSLPQNPTRAGYVFKGWYSDVNCTVAYTAASPVSADLTLFAKWEEDPTTNVQLEEAKAVLNSKIAEVKDKTKGDYSDASWNAFQNALAAAKEAAASKTASAADVRKALDSLKKAEQNLKVAGSEPDTGKETETETETGKETETNKRPETPSTQPGTEKPNTNPNTQKVPAVGTTKPVGRGFYKVTKSDAKNGTVALVKPRKATEKKFTVPGTVKIDGVTFKVTEISKNAFKNNKKLTQVIIGKNVSKIGANAFNGAKKLKKITIKSTQLKKVGSKAFKGIDKKCKIKVPKKKLTRYKRLLKGKGQKASVKITK